MQRRVLAAIALGDLQYGSNGRDPAGQGPETRKPLCRPTPRPQYGPGVVQVLESQAPLEPFGNQLAIRDGPADAPIHHLTNLALSPQKIMRDEDPESSFARNGSTHPMGKFDAKLPDTNCHAEFLDALQMEAARAGVPVGELIRTTLYVRVFGFEHVASMEAQRIKRIAGNVTA